MKATDMWNFRVFRIVEFVSRHISSECRSMNYQYRLFYKVTDNLPREPGLDAAFAVQIYSANRTMNHCAQVAY